MKENNTYNEELGGKNLPDSLRVNPFAIPNHFFAEQENQILLQMNLESLRDFNDSNVSETTVPEGYFDTLENNIFAKIAEQDLKDKVSESGFAVPDQYFEQFGQFVEGQIAEENLKSFSPTLEYQVPEDYFAKAEESIFAKIMKGDFLDKVGKDSGFTVPAKYLAQATAEIEDRILVEKWSTKFGKDHFNVPVGYFDQLSDRILANTIGSKDQEKGQVINLPKRTIWKKYAAAASAVIVGSVAYFGLQNTNSNTQVQQQLASSDVNLENISDDEILSYLAQVSEGEDLIQLAKFASDDNDENTALDSDIEDDEIEDYLNYML